MSALYKVIVDHAPSQADNDVVREGLVSFNEHIMGEPRDKEFSVFLKDGSGKIFGGIQAHSKDFYLKHGYEIFGVLDNCPKGHKRYYLKKTLQESNDYE